MIAVDTNILVYAHRLDSPWNHQAHACITRLWSGTEQWMIPWACLHEFICVATHRQIHRPPSTPAEALEQVDEWLESPTLVLGTEGTAHWPALRPLLAMSSIIGPMTYDARIAAICLQAGVTTLWTADRDFSRFPDLHCENPLVRRK